MVTALQVQREIPFTEKCYVFDYIGILFQPFTAISLIYNEYWQLGKLTFYL